MNKKLTNLPLVSITITTKNEAKNITACLQSIKNQTYPQNKIEIVVVDNNSIDQTKKIARKYTSKVYNFGPERSSQRNFGMLKKSKGKYVMFLDADMTLSSNVIEKAVYQLESSNLVGLYIPELILGNSYWSKVRNFERSFYNGTVIDCVRFIRSSAFLLTKGFDVNLTGPEDWDFDKRIRLVGKVDLLKSSGAIIYHHENQISLKKYLTKKNYYAKSFNLYIKKWGQNDSDIKKQFGFWYRYFGVFSEHGKWKKLLNRSSLLIGMYLLRIMVGIGFLWQKIKKAY